MSCASARCSNKTGANRNVFISDGECFGSRFHESHVNECWPEFNHERLQLGSDGKAISIPIPSGFRKDGTDKWPVVVWIFSNIHKSPQAGKVARQCALGIDSRIRHWAT